ncbi:MAG: response regulator transcription factor [Prevotella sp.]|jgi:DNA-binding NarL/FixJ family response regulator
MDIILADRQEITRAGLLYVINQRNESDVCKYVDDKTEMIEQLKLHPEGVVVLDYTLFDINDAEELLILSQRFSKVSWILFSEDLSVDFIRRVLVSSQQFSIVLKDAPLSEIREAFDSVSRHHRFICQHATELLISPEPKVEEKVNLTKTETEILKDIALGMTTREIAEKRFSSFHTVNTHRKNIFRKLGVNNVHEATKYALRAGLVDSAEYYI